MKNGSNDGDADDDGDAGEPLRSAWKAGYLF